MIEIANPFVYDAASTLGDQQVLDYYVDDHNFARLIQSKRNVFLIGERGSGKTMTLLYNSFKIQALKARNEGQPPSLDFVGVLVPCNTPLNYKKEHQLLDEFQASIVSEHLLALSIAYQVADTLATVPELMAGADESILREELGFVLGIDLPSTRPLFPAIQQALDHEAVEAQRSLNQPNLPVVYDKSLSFSTLVMPLLQAVSRIPSVSNSHFMLMIDDAHDLNEYQVRALNSWIAYRDRSLFSFKVATARVGRPARVTSAGGSLLEGHDYITIDLEQPIHNEESNFGQLAEKIVRARLKRAGVNKEPSEFFPEAVEFQNQLQEAEVKVRARAHTLHPDGDQKKISDYVYKFKRIEYFRSRDPKANLPQYSGFSTIVYISTGVVRNLLEPCWWMYDAALSRIPQGDRGVGCVQEIAAAIQSDSLLERSKAAWQRLQELDQFVDGCSAETGERVYRLFDRLASYFRERLLRHSSEPGAISFSISEQSSPSMSELHDLLEIAQKAQMLYVREGPAKAAGRRETFYVPNRILWPIRGLDPHGQHARASIKASSLLAASMGKDIPFHGEGDPDVVQTELSI
jgi:hypothetical protein